MGFFSMLSWSSMWSVFGFVSLISMIWVAGPAIQIAEYKPLAPLWARITLTLVVSLVFLGIYIYKWYKNKKLNEHVIEEIKASEVEGKPKDSDSQLTQQFTTIDLLLQKHEKQKSDSFFDKIFANKDDYIYQKPWFLVVGAPGVGKTSAILNSGLTFPIGFEEDNAAKLAGTRDCDWFLTDESLLLDTAGRFITQDNDETNTEDWNELLALLKRCRTKQPINGLVLMISVDDIMSNDDEKIKNQIQQIRLRLQELQDSLKTSFPLYILINKIDLISGFSQYFNLLDEEERKKGLGIQLDPLTETSAEKLNHIVSKLNIKVEEIRNNLFSSVVHNNQVNDPSDLALSFASEFSIFNSSLKGYLKRLLNLSKYDSDINLAGIYFTSATQQNDSTEAMLGSSNEYVLQSKYVENHNSTLVAKSQPYFLAHFFDTFLFNTANLAGIDSLWMKRQQKIYWLSMVLSVGVILLCSFLLLKAYGRNNDYLSLVSGQLEHLEKDLKTQQASNILDLLKFSYRIYEIPSHNINKNLINDSVVDNLGLYQYNDVEKAAQAKYQHLIDDSFIPSVSNTIETELRNSLSLGLNDQVYKNLKAYLMLHQTEHYDKEYISQWVIENLSKSTDNTLDLNESSLAVLKKMLSERQILPNSSLDSGLVRKARTLLANEDIANIIYKNLETHVSFSNTEGMPEVSFVSMGGPSTQNLFRRISDKTLNDPMHILYTKYGYENLFKNFVGESIKNFYQKEKWVMGEDLSIRPKQQVVADIYQRYTDNYINAWQDYLDDIEMVNPKSLQQTVSMAKKLSEKNSSLAGIIKGVSENTNLLSKDNSTTADTGSEKTEKGSDVASQASDLTGAAIKAVDSKDKIKEELINSSAATLKNKTVGIKDSDIQGYLQDISTRFAQFQTLTESSAESGSQLNEITSSINDLYVYAIALQRSIQNNDTLMPDDKPLINYQAQVSRLPDPFQPMLDTLESEISQERINHINNKQQEEKERLEKEAFEVEQENIEKEEKAALETAEAREKLTLQTAIEQDKIVENKCINATNGKYPFSAKSEHDLSLEELSQLFSKSGMFLRTLEGNISIVNQEGMALFRTLLDSGKLDRDNTIRQKSYIEAGKINSMYLAGANKPHLGIATRVVAMDKDIETLTMSYDGQKIQYYHGPQKNYLINWPAKKNAQFSLKTTSAKSRPASLSVKGDWSIFRLLDKATKVTQTKDGKGVLAVFLIDKNKVQIEFKSVSGANPFNLSIFNNFQC